MARPAIVLGLGGTGHWVLTHVKKDLIESHGGRAPEQVKLLGFDLVNYDQATQDRGGAKAEKPVEVGGVTLGPDEYTYLGGYVKDFVEAVARGQHPQLGSWFQASSYLERLPNAAFHLAEGAGQFRQFGRLAVFHDVMQGQPNSRIYRRLHQALQDVQAKGGGAGVDAILVASLTGGTGAGMFVDMAHLIREIARYRCGNLHVTIRGFLVLPKAFGRVIEVGPGVSARCYSALREIKRFMVSFDWDIGYPMRYLETGDDLWVGKIRSKLFDFLYLLDGHGRQVDLSKHVPREGVYPGIADAISTILDEGGAGTAITQHTQNVEAQAGDQAKASTAYYSAVGSYSMVLPVHNYVEEFSHRLALEALDVLLAPAGKDRHGVPTGIASDRNEERSGISGRDEVANFLKIPAWDLGGGRAIQNTMYTHEVARILERYRPDDRSLVDELAGRGLRWLDVFSPPGDDADIKSIRDEVEHILKARLRDEVQPSRVFGDKPKDALSRVEQGVQEFKTRQFGRVQQSGVTQGGQYRNALHKYRDIHVRRFSRLLNLQVAEMLNGGHSNSAIARGGKLGYVKDFLVGLSMAIDRFREILYQVDKARVSQGKTKDAMQQAEAARQRYKENSHKTWLVGQFGQGYTTQEEYLDREMELVEWLRVDVLQSFVQDSADQLKNYVEGALKTVDRWTETLATGQEPEGLYATILKRQLKVQATRKGDAEVKVRGVIDDPRYEEQLYRRYGGDKLGELVGSFEWRLPEDTFDLECWVTSPADAQASAFGGIHPGQNAELLLNRCRGYFSGIPNQETVLSYLMAKYATPGELGDDLFRKTDLYLGFDQARATIRMPANFLRVMYGQTPAEERWCKDAVERVGQKLQTDDANLHLVKTANPHVCTLLYTTDLLDASSLHEYNQGLNTYLQYADDKFGDDRRILHTFPAEVHAVQYEGRMRELKAQPRLLHDEVVLQLEDRSRYLLFVKCLAYGVIQRCKEGRKLYWALRFRLESSDGKEEFEEIELTEKAERTPDLMQALTTFNFLENDYRSRKGTYNHPIDYQRVEKELDRILEAPSPSASGVQEGEIEALDIQLSKVRVTLETTVKDLESGDDRHKDLAAVLHLALRDEQTHLNELKRQVTASMR